MLCLGSRLLFGYEICRVWRFEFNLGERAGIYFIEVCAKWALVLLVMLL